ncbi:MAG TPA: Gfo/Idh/MocA family oxidoreductase [Symbiobacteriaceae bacterium]|jgi:virulence factor
MNKVTVGVVGLGGIARKAHLPVLTAHPGVEIVALCSRTGEQVAELASQYRLQLQARTFPELLALRPQAAYLLSPTALHPEQAVSLLEAGVAVYLEKPLANDLAEARRIVAAAGQPGRLLMVGFNRRYAPAYRRVRALFAGRRMEFIQIHKHRERGSKGWPLRQIIMDDTIHIIDLARFYAGELTVQVAHARLGLVAAQLLAPDGTLVQLSQSFGAGRPMERLEVHGDGLSVIVEGMERLTVVEGGVERAEPIGQSWTATLEKRGMASATDHFLHCLRTGVQPETDGAEALRTQELAEAILPAGS